MRRSRRQIAALLLASAAAAGACTVPVFRYALDRWTADAYRLEVPEGWDTTAAGESLRELLDESGMPIEIVPGEDADGLARLVTPGESAHVVWNGRLDEGAANLFLSPAREELANRILAGESMVWVMVASGAEEKDGAFAERLQARLAYLAEVAAIPEQDPHDPESQLGPGPELRVGFSFLKVARDDPAEQVFLRMLAGPDGDALLTGEEPFAAVVFGRGRVLGAWDAAALDDEGIDEVSLFLLGACSCRVKFQNPGWDLAMAVDWETRLMAAQMEAERGEEEGEAGVESADEPVEAPHEPEVVTFGGEEEERPASAEAETAGVSMLVIFTFVAGALALFAGAAIFLRRAH